MDCVNCMRESSPGVVYAAGNSSFFFKSKNGEKTIVLGGIDRPQSADGLFCPGCGQSIFNYKMKEELRIIECTRCGCRLETGKIYVYDQFFDIGLFFKSENGSERRIDIEENPGGGILDLIKPFKKKNARAFLCSHCSTLVFRYE